MSLTSPNLTQIAEARKRLSDLRHTPLLKCQITSGDSKLYIKLENLQHAGSFKVRGAGNAIHQAAAAGVKRVWTASAGNMGMAVAWYAARVGIKCTVVVPQDAPSNKLHSIQSLGGEILLVSRDEYWEIQTTHHMEGIEGTFIHPFADQAVMAGNATLAYEILEDLPEVDAVVAPYGGGGLSCGLAAALRHLSANTRVYAAETENGAPLGPSLEKGELVKVPYWKSFLSGIGSHQVFGQMWPLTRDLITGSVIVGLDQIAGAMAYLLEEEHVLAEGAGAISLAAALSGQVPGKSIVCVITGGNVSLEQFNDILIEYGIRAQDPD